jgi:RHS repeat-associated protein
MPTAATTTVTTVNTTYWPLYDANGNVSEYLAASDNSIAAHYEYDPFGNTTLASGPHAADFAHRFSTKFLDAETGLYYYGYRYLNTEMGRWVIRDPAGLIERNNLYLGCRNSSLVRVDPLGLEDLQPVPAVIPYLDPPCAVNAKWRLSAQMGDETKANLDQIPGLGKGETYFAVKCSCDLQNKLFCVIALRPMIFIRDGEEYKRRGRFGHEQLHVRNLITVFGEFTTATTPCVEKYRNCPCTHQMATDMEKRIRDRWVKYVVPYEAAHQNFQYPKPGERYKLLDENQAPLSDDGTALPTGYYGDEVTSPAPTPRNPIYKLNPCEKP